MSIRKVFQTIGPCTLCGILLLGCAKTANQGPDGSKGNSSENSNGVTGGSTDRETEPSAASEPSVVSGISIPSDFSPGSFSSEDSKEEKAEKLLSKMTLHEKICQLFVVVPEALKGSLSPASALDAGIAAGLKDYPVGGLVFFKDNLSDPEGTTNFLKDLQECSSVPLLLALDEEGGRVARIGNHPAFSVPSTPPMFEVGQTEQTQQAFEAGWKIGKYLSDYGFNMDFAPVADVWTNPENTVIGNRSFGSDPKLVSDMSIALAKGLESNGVCPTFKHFPGHGDTAEDSHTQTAYVNKTLAELEECELLPFRNAISEGCFAIMVGHISLPAVTGDERPASLSRTILTELLREQMGFQGVILTDALNMSAITQQFDDGEAAVCAIEAGADILLMPRDFQAAVAGVEQALETGRLSEERINESLRRILGLKMDFGLLPY